MRIFSFLCFAVGIAVFMNVLLSGHNFLRTSWMADVKNGARDVSDRMGERKSDADYAVEISCDDSKGRADIRQICDADFFIDRQPPYDLGKELSDRSAWAVGRDEFLRRHPGVYYSCDGISRCSLRREDVLFWGCVVCEDTLHFTEEGLSKVEVSIFNKGIAASFASEAEANEAVNAISAGVSADRVDVVSSEDGFGKSIVHYSWVGSCPSLKMAMGLTTIEGVRVVEYLNASLTIGAETPPAATVRTPESNVRRDGCDVYIDGIPMVNQGRKGYCVPATIERILKYYGIDADMHELALVMETECGGGTQVGGDFPTLDRIAGETDLVRTDYANQTRYDDEFFERYNMAARAVGAKELHIEDYTIAEDDGKDGVVNMRHYDWMAKAVNDDLERKSRCYDALGYAKFRSGIVSCVSVGYPLMWSVDRLFPWDKPSGEGGSGHMRLIVGYNVSSEEIIYSDSWGSGNEFKRAPMMEAWESTRFLSCLSPAKP